METYQLKITIMIVILCQSSQLGPRVCELSYHCMNLAAGKTEAGSQHRFEAPHRPTKEAAIPADRGRKNKYKATRGVALFIVCRRRGFPGGRRKRKTRYSPPVSSDIPFLTPLLQASGRRHFRIEEATYKTSDSVD